MHKPVYDYCKFCTMHGLQFATPLEYAAKGGLTTCVEHLLSTPGIELDDVFQAIFISKADTKEEAVEPYEEPFVSW